MSWMILIIIALVLIIVFLWMGICNDVREIRSENAVIKKQLDKLSRQVCERDVDDILKRHLEEKLVYYKSMCKDGATIEEIAKYFIEDNGILVDKAIGSFDNKYQIELLVRFIKDHDIL